MEMNNDLRSRHRLRISDKVKAAPSEYRRKPRAEKSVITCPGKCWDEVAREAVGSKMAGILSCGAVPENELPCAEQSFLRAWKTAHDIEISKCPTFCTRASKGEQRQATLHGDCLSDRLA